MPTELQSRTQPSPRRTAAGGGIVLENVSRTYDRRRGCGLHALQGVSLRAAHGEVLAVVGRLEGGRLLLDLRSVSPEDDERLVHAILTARGGPP